MLSIQADDAEKWQKAKDRKKNPDKGFAGHFPDAPFKVIYV